jgi:hypothetical protein
MTSADDAGATPGAPRAELSAEERALIGTYRLQEFRDIADDGEIRHPLGVDPVGFITYTAERYMLAILTAANRTPFAGGDIMSGTDEERVQAFASASAYAGSWYIDDGEVVHHLDTGTFPNWAGTVQRRPFELRGDELMLYPPRLLMAGKMRRSELRWQRLQPEQPA